MNNFTWEDWHWVKKIIKHSEFFVSSYNLWFANIYLLYCDNVCLYSPLLFTKLVHFMLSCSPHSTVKNTALSLGNLNVLQALHQK